MEIRISRERNLMFRPQKARKKCRRDYDD